MCIKVSKKLSITSYNINGLYKRISGDRICKLDDNNFGKFMTSDIIFLSETHSPQKMFYLILVISVLQIAEKLKPIEWGVV